MWRGLIRWGCDGVKIPNFKGCICCTRTGRQVGISISRLNMFDVSVDGTSIWAGSIDTEGR